MGKSDYDFKYGVQPEDRSVVRYKRLQENGLILGYPRSGKTVIAKKEIVSVMQNTEDVVYIIDQKGDYKHLAEENDGEIVTLGEKQYINPFDLYIDSDMISDTSFSIGEKIDFICELIETMSGRILSPLQKKIISSCLHPIYTYYIENIETKIDREKSPVLLELYHRLKTYDLEEGKTLASILEPYIKKNSVDLFLHKTNIHPSTRLLIYDLSKVQPEMKDLTLKICLSDIWNRTRENGSKHRYSWIYIDEITSLLKDNPSDFLSTIWKRIRLHWGTITGISTSVNVFLKSDIGRQILSTCSYVFLLHLSKNDLLCAKEPFNLSVHDSDFLSNAKLGDGVICCNRTMHCSFFL